MATANRTSYAILGLLSQGPKSGYEIKQVVERTISHFWKESYGHLYPTLSRLMDEGLVRREAEGGRHSRERQRYHLYAEEQPGLEASAAAGEPGAVYELITLSLGVHISTARVAWCDEALARLAPLDPAATGPGA
jgi:PadR family transcriptional regulator, regulatory protein AphA